MQDVWALQCFHSNNKGARRTCKTKEAFHHVGRSLERREQACREVRSSTKIQFQASLSQGRAMSFNCQGMACFHNLIVRLLYTSHALQLLAHTWQAQTAFVEHASNDQGGEKGVRGHILSVPQARTWASTEESWVSTMEWMMDCGWITISMSS